MNDLSRVFKSQMNWLIEEIKELPALKTNSLNNDKIEEILKRLPKQDTMVKAIITKASVTLYKGGNRSMKELDLAELGISFSLKHPDAVKFLKAKATLELSNYKGNITSNTKDKIKKILVKGIDEGKSYTELATQIRAQADAGVFSRARAELIATREMGVAYETGRKVPIDEFVGKYPDRLMQKVWQTVGGGAANNVTPECEANEAEDWINYNESWSSGDKEPPREGNPRCRCTCSYQIV